MPIAMETMVVVVAREAINHRWPQGMIVGPVRVVIRAVGIIIVIVWVRIVIVRVAVSVSHTTAADQN